MNYALDLSLRLERFLERLQSETSSSHSSQSPPSSSYPAGPYVRNSYSTSNLDAAIGGAGPTPGTYGLQYEGRPGGDHSLVLPYVGPFVSGGGGGGSGTQTPVRPGTPGVAGRGGNAPTTISQIEDLEERALQLAIEEGKPVVIRWPKADVWSAANSVSGIRETLSAMGGQCARNAHRCVDSARRLGHRRPGGLSS